MSTHRMFSNSATTSIIRSVSNAYKYSIITSGIVGTCYGSYMGTELASRVTFNKSNLSLQEYVGETCCYGIIMTSTTLCHGMLSIVYAGLLPVSLPITLYIISNSE